MHLSELFIIAVGVSMDAFAVSICKGLSVRTLQPKHSAATALWFGGFQALMPVIGYFLASSFANFVASVDHWIAFILLGIIGFNMIREALGPDEECLDCSFTFRAMLPLAVATSIDALAVGVTFAFLKVNIVPAVLFIGVITCVLSMLGVKLGNVFGAKWKKRAELAGGAILICMGLKILIEHLFF